MVGVRTLSAFCLPQTKEHSEEKSAASQQMRSLLRGLERNDMPADKQNGFLELSGSSPKEEKKETVKPGNKYRYREVEARILRAKNALSAGQALLAAKRKVQEVKRKLANADGDEEELAAALTHAKRMELVARKKKHHLELEELADHTRERDERQEAEHDAIRGTESAAVSAAEEEISEQEDAVLEAQEEALEEAGATDMESGPVEQADLSEAILSIGEDTLEELEESMEFLENMEVIDPHMSEDELEELKRKHRAAEQKALMKADMDYLKTIIRLQTEKAGTLPGISGSAGSGAVLPVSFSMPASGGVAVDVQV